MENVEDVSETLATYHFFASGNHGPENSRNITAAGSKRLFEKTRA
jgi:hypothetical protein